MHLKTIPFKKIKTIGLISGFIVAIFIIIPGHAIVTCGVIDDDSYLNGSRYRMTCDAFDYGGTYCACDNGFEDADSSFDQICVEYDYDHEDSDTLYMANCTVLYRFCTVNRYTNTGDYQTEYCDDCPKGLAGGPDVDSAHSNTTCQYCAAGYYGVAPDCTPCPNGGTTKNTNSTDITSCYIIPPAGTQTDHTGTFIYVPDAPECWWKI